MKTGGGGHRDGTVLSIANLRCVNDLFPFHVCHTFCTSSFSRVNYSRPTFSAGILNYGFRNEQESTKQNQANDVSCN